MPSKHKIERVFSHHLESQNTNVHVIMSHEIQGVQNRLFKQLHGKDSNIIHHEVRFEDFEHFKKYFLKLTQEQETAAIYFVCKSSWRVEILDKYKDKINGTTIGWFVGFGNDEKYSSQRKKLVCRYSYLWLEVPIEFNSGRADLNVRSYLHEESNN